MINTFGLKTEYTPTKQVGENVYIISWGYEDIFEDVYQKDEQGETILDDQGLPIPTGEKLPTDLASWTSEIYHFKPSVDYLKNVILDWHNKRIDEKILNGFVWRDMPIWLSQENQFNYKSAYDLAVQTQGKSLPAKFKFGTADTPVYYEFATLKELSDFYTKAMAYINDTLNEGWVKKDGIDWSAYDIK